jgi:ketosteroid isomerase-like protein
MNAFSWTAPKEPADAEAAPPPELEVAPPQETAPSEARTYGASVPVVRPPRPAAGGRQKPDTPSSHPNAQRIRDCYAALEKRDLDAAFRDFSPGFKLEVPPQLPFDPGDVRGPMVVMGLFRKMLELTGGQFKNELLTVTAADDMAVALNRVTVTRRGNTRVYHASWTYRIIGDKIVEGWLHVSLSPDDLRAVFS